MIVVLAFSETVASTSVLMQADDDRYVSSLTLKLRYSKHTQHTAFSLNIVANKKKNYKLTIKIQVYKGPQVRKWLYIINIA